MSIRLAAPLALFALSCAAPTFAAADHGAHAGQSTEQAAPAEEKNDKQRKVCRRETETGSVMPKRICRTVAQMEEEQRQAERYRQEQNRAGGTSAR